MTNLWRWWVGLAVMMLIAAGVWWLAPSMFAQRKLASENDQIFETITYEIQDTQDEKLVRDIKLRLLQQMNWQQVDGDWQLQLGAFMLLKDEQVRTDACANYSAVIYNLVASGVIVGGERPGLTVTAPCQEVSGYLVLPKLSLSQVQSHVQGASQWQSDRAHYIAHRLDEEWFTEWDLNTIELVPVSQAPAILIDSIEIQAVRPGFAPIQ
ncbi:MAG: hypothetical protein AB7N80_09085 [Bdellovibrionales bacterium]